MITVHGTVVDANAQPRSDALRLELWRAGPRTPQQLAATYVGPAGHFRFSLDELNAADEELEFRIFDDSEPLPSNERHARRYSPGAIHVTLQTDTSSEHPEALVIETLADLRARETEVLERIHRLPNGARLFFLNPLRTLNDAGVRLTDVGLYEFLEHFPYAGEAGRCAYYAVRAAAGAQNCTVQLQRLFKDRAA